MFRKISRALAPILILGILAACKTTTAVTPMSEGPVVLASGQKVECVAAEKDFGDGSRSGLMTCFDKDGKPVSSGTYANTDLLRDILAKGVPAAGAAAVLGTTMPGSSANASGGSAVAQQGQTQSTSGVSGNVTNNN